MWPFASKAQAELIPIDPEAAALLNRMRASYPDATHYAHSVPNKIGVSAGKAAESDIGMTNIFGATRTRSRNPAWIELLDAIGIPLDSLITVPYSQHNFVANHMSNLVEAAKFFGQDPNMLQEDTMAHEMGHAVAPGLLERETDLFRTRPLRDPRYVFSEGVAKGVYQGPYWQGLLQARQVPLLGIIEGLAKKYGSPSTTQQIDWQGPPQDEKYLDRYWKLIEILDKFNEPGKHSYTR